LAAGVVGTVRGVTRMKGESGKGSIGGGKRILTIGERGTERKVVLVRPNVVVGGEETWCRGGRCEGSSNAG